MLGRHRVCCHPGSSSRRCESRSVSTSLKVIQPPAALLLSRGLRSSAEREGPTAAPPWAPASSHQPRSRRDSCSCSPRDAVSAPPAVCARSGRPGPRRFSPASREGAGALRRSGGARGGPRAATTDGSEPAACAPAPLAALRGLPGAALTRQPAQTRPLAVIHEPAFFEFDPCLAKVLGKGVSPGASQEFPGDAYDRNKAKRSASSRAPSCFLPLRLPVHCQQRGERARLEANPP